MKRKQQEEEDDELEDFLDIDEDNLDTEWFQQPKKFFRWSRKLADARMKWDEAKNELEITYAELDSEIREDPEKFDLPKVTEASVKACILKQKRYQDTFEDVLKCKHIVDVLQGAVKALEHRKTALENAVDLFGMGYFSEPRAKKGSRDTLDELNKRKVHDRMEKRRPRAQEGDD